MAKYKVDKKLFEQKILEEQLKQVELQSKYLKDEPLKRSEVDEYNKLQASGWVRNTLITLGVTFSTAIAVIIFILLGNMLITNGRSGNVGKVNLDSNEVYSSFLDSEFNLEPSQTPNAVVYVTYKVPYKWDKGTLDLSDDITFLLSQRDDVYVDYRLEWRQTGFDVNNAPIVGMGEWIVGRDPSTNSIGSFTQSDTLGKDNDIYALDVKTVNLNRLMTDWFKGQEDGFAKTLIEDFFYTAWPLTLVLWMVFIGSIAGYTVVLVVGIRYVIRTVISVLRKAGYIASDFVTEVVDAVKSEIPIVESEEVKEIDFSAMRKQLTKTLEEERVLFEPKEDRKEPVSLNDEKTLSVKAEQVEKPITEPVVEKEKTGEKTASDKILDIFG